MANYIQHSACIDFTIYSGCTIDGQAFRFTNAGTLSTLVGGSDSGDDLNICANDTNLCASIKLFGDEGITSKIKWNSTFEVSTCSDEELLVVSPTALTYKGTNICLAPCGEDYTCPTKGDLPFTLYEDCTTETGIGLQFSVDGVNSIIAGGNIANDYLTLKGNSTDAYSFIKIYGAGNIHLNVGNEDEIIFKEGTSTFFTFDRTGNLSKLSGGTAAIDDLSIYANSNVNCPMIELSGNEGIVNKIKAASGFEVSTCSDETLWEVDSNPADKHVDFHCLDAHNFVLELRTSNPSSPTCTGQIWFRTDLV